MIKRTPQEIADFFGCYVAMAADGTWYITTEKPEKNTFDWKIQRYNRWHKIKDFMIDVPSDHDWTKLYEPQGKEGKTEEDSPYFTETADSDNKEAPYSGKQADSDNKHQSQVHVHQEYDVIYAEYPERLSIEVTQLIHEGWKPVGGIVCLPPAHREDSETFYQAMVRGLE